MRVEFECIELDGTIDFPSCPVLDLSITKSPEIIDVGCLEVQVLQDQILDDSIRE